MKQTIQWRKIPSVTPGGKPYFYHGNAVGSSIVWNRVDKKYHATIFGVQIGLFDSISQAKKNVQAYYDLELEWDKHNH